VSKSRSRSPKSRASASRAKSTKKGARTSAVKRTTMAGSRAPAARKRRNGTDLKKLRKDLERAVANLGQRTARGETDASLYAAQEVFSRWMRDIDDTVCVGAAGPCGSSMFIGS
jgi:hypothetical protein